VKSILARNRYKRSRNARIHRLAVGDSPELLSCARASDFSALLWSPFTGVPGFVDVRVTEPLRFGSIVAAAGFSLLADGFVAAACLVHPATVTARASSIALTMNFFMASLL
jgi:hypothetical protein